MKKLLIPAFVVVFLTGCDASIENVTGFSKPQLRSDNPGLQQPRPRLEKSETTDAGNRVAVSEPTRVRFPLEKTITDARGRSIEARILAKKGNQIAIARIPSNQRFVLSLETLSRADREVFAGISDGGDFGSVSAEAGGAARSPERKAVWHAHISNAEEEAKRLGIPLLVAVSNGMDRKASADFEKALVYSREFKAWADQNVALCLLEVESGSRESTFETWKTLANYGIMQSRENVVALINPLSFTSEAIPLSGAASASQMIGSLDRAIRRKSSWASISVAPVPQRQTSPFRVNGGAKFVGGLT